MKKLVTGILAMLLCFGCLAGCGETTDNSSSTPDASTPNASTPDTSTPDTPADPADPHEVDLADVKDYVFEQMSKKNLETRESFTVINTFSFIGAEEKYDIAWSLDVTEGVTITEGETEDTVVIAALDEDLPFTLTATITDPEGCHTTSFSLDGLAKAMPQIVPLAITEKPAENTAYKLYVYQSTLAKDLYFNGYDKAATYYFGTTENYEEAVDIYVEYIEGTDNFNLTFTYEDVKKYIGVRLSDDGAHDNIVATTEPVSSFFWSEELGTVLTHLDKNKNGEAADYYLGNYSNKDTISLSMTSYAGGAGNNVGGLVTMVDKSTIVITDETKVNTVKDALNVATKHTTDKTVTLTTSDDRYPEVSITWTVEEGKGATVTADGLVLAIPAEATTAVLTATVSCGEVTETKEFTLELGPKSVAPAADSVLTIKEALAYGNTLTAPTTDKYYVSGVITGFYGSGGKTYGNVYIQDETGDSILVYGLYSADGSVRYDKMEVKPVEGDTIKVYGALTSYNGVGQFKDAWLIEHTPAAGGETPDVGGDEEPSVQAPAADSVLTIKEALEYGATLTADTTDKYYVSGVITGFYGDKGKTYGNVYIQDEKGDSILVYGLYSADGSVRYDAMEVKPVEGDTIKVYSILSSYKGVAQFKNAWLIEHTPAAGGETPDQGGDEGDAATVTASKTIADLITSEGWTNTTTKQEFSLDDVVTVKVNGGNNSGKAYDGNHIRIYATDTPAGTLTITLAEGYELVSIKVSTVSAGTDAFLYVDGSTEDIKDTVTLVSGSSVVLNTVKNGSNGKQVRVTAIEVVYKAK